MRTAVVGSRGFDDYGLLKEILRKHQISKIISGGARGADELAERFAEEYGIETEIYKPDWKAYGRSAGPKRNKTIVENSDKVIAFWDGKSRGTKSSIDHAKKVGKELVVVLYTKSA